MRAKPFGYILQSRKGARVVTMLGCIMLIFANQDVALAYRKRHGLRNYRTSVVKTREDAKSRFDDWWVMVRFND